MQSPKIAGNAQMKCKIRKQAMIITRSGDDDRDRPPDLRIKKKSVSQVFCSRSKCLSIVLSPSKMPKLHAPCISGARPLFQMLIIKVLV